MIDRTTGNTGIGIIPQQKLDVAGTVRAEQFVYAAPQTRYLNLPMDAFTSVNPQFYQAAKSIISTGGNNVTGMLTISGGTLNVPGYVSAPVNFPQGATVTKMELIAYDNDANVIALQATFSVLAASGGGVGVVYSQSASLAAENTVWQTASADLNHPVRNDLYQYKVIVKLNENTTNTRLFGVRFTYTVTQPD